MKLPRPQILIVAICLSAAPQVHAQGTFQNLGFESAQIIPLTEGADFPPYSVATTNLLPGWTLYYGFNPQSQLTYNDPALGSTFATLWATNGAQISGNYSILLQGGLTESAASISQSSLVPVSAESLLFEAQQTGAGTLQVSLGGQILPFFALSNGPNYTLYGVDISAFAGQTEQLMFSALKAPGFVNNWNIDNIQFSDQPVPEPGTFGLFALGASPFLWRARIKR